MKNNNVPQITKIFWKRTYLFVEYYSVEIYDVCLIKQNKRVHFEQKQLDEYVYRAKLNLCIAEGRLMLDEGEWEIHIGDRPIFFIQENVLENFETISNVFRYDNDKAYLVTFHLDDKGEGLVSLKLKADYMTKNKHPKWRINKLFFLKNILNLWYQFVCLFSRKKGNRVLFMSENRAAVTGNLKAIYDRMVERGLDKEYQLNLSFRNIFAQKQGPLDWLKIVTKIAVHDFIFVEDYVPVFGFLDLDKRTILVQTWHAGFGFKSVGYGRFGLEGSPNPFQSCHRKYTYALIGNDHLREIYSEVFGIEKESLLATGMPRLSNFLNQEKIEQTRQKIYGQKPFLKEKQIITFAPTYRGANQKEAYYDIEKINQKELYEFCMENNAVILFKFHPFLKGQKFIELEYEKCLIDLSEWDLNDLFYVTDVLITDYSSCFYDYLLLNKPVLFYIYDEAVYSATRGVHRPVSKVAPGKICKSFDEVLDSLRKKEYEEVKLPEFMIDKCVSNKELSASDKVIDYIILGKKDIIL